MKRMLSVFASASSMRAAASNTNQQIIPSTKNHHRHVVAAAAVIPSTQESIHSTHLKHLLQPSADTPFSLEFTHQNPSLITFQNIPRLNLGYACDNLTLRQSRKLYTSRTCQLRTFQEQGLSHLSQLALKNCVDLIEIIKWNHENDIKFFRLSSKLFPWPGHYNIQELPDFPTIAEALLVAGELARAMGQRITNHPPHFIKLATTDDAIRQQSIANLEVQGKVFDLMGYQPSHWNKINIHIGGVYANKQRTMERFARTFDTLSDSVKARLTVENDDRCSSYSVQDLMSLHAMTSIPITFDFHHHQFCDGGQSQQDAFETALTTWPSHVRPVVHWSEMPECPERQRTHPYAHSNFVYGPINLYGHEEEVDVMIESKAKEAALLLYRDEIMPRLCVQGWGRKKEYLG